uniref:ATP-binding cassette domain-containing protein n=1 Tax=Spiroplasma taiwanense TaxID=2145 RepID=UPI000A058BB3
MKDISKWKIKTLEFKNISIKRNDSLIIKNLSFTFKENKKYLITGKSGVGKSTLLNSFIGLLPINNGEVFINSKEIKKKNLINLRSDIEYI